MSRLISVSLTEAAVVARTKTVTRRLGWDFLQPGDSLTLCRKVMGRRRPDGTVDPLVRLAEVVVVEVRPTILSHFPADDIAAEGLPGADTPDEFVRLFCAAMKCTPDAVVNRIEWVYL